MEAVIAWRTIGDRLSGLCGACQINDRPPRKNDVNNTLDIVRKWLGKVGNAKAGSIGYKDYMKMQ